MSKEIGEEYSSSLADLTVNSKPLINMLTILAEENIDHAAIIVDSVEKHLEKVRPDIKLPVLYLVDSIIKNVGGAYTQLFSQIIVNMFCKTFKQVDEKTRSQMFKLRETWHDVFPALKLYQLDVKVNVVDPAWPIQAQPPQPAVNIHLNPNFLKKGGSSATSVQASGTSSNTNEKMLSALALKEQELLQLRQRKIDMELEQTKRQLAEQAKRQQLSEHARVYQATAIQPAIAVADVTLPVGGLPFPPGMAVSTIPPVLGQPPNTNAMTPSNVPPLTSPTKQRLGPATANSVNVAISIPGPAVPPLAGGPMRRRDPRLARIAPVHVPAPAMQTHPTSTPTHHRNVNNVFDIPPLEDSREKRERERDRDRIRDRRSRDRALRQVRSRQTIAESTRDTSIPVAPPVPPTAPAPPPNVAANARSVRLPPIPKLNKKNIVDGRRDRPRNGASASPVKKNLTVEQKEKETQRTKDYKKDKVSPSDSEGTKISPRSKKNDNKKVMRTEREKPVTPLMREPPPAPKEVPLEEPVPPPAPTKIAFKELKTSAKDRNYVRRNRDKSESPEKMDEGAAESTSPVAESTSTITDIVVGNGLPPKDVDLRLLPKPAPAPAPVVVRKRPSTEHVVDTSNVKKSKAERLDALFGDEDVDLRKLPPMEPLSPPPPPKISMDDENYPASPASEVSSKDGWAKMKQPKVNPTTPPRSDLDIVRAKLAEATKGKDRLGRPLLYNKLPDDPDERKRTITLNSEDTDMRPKHNLNSETPEDFDKSIKIIMSQAEEEVKSGSIDADKYNTLIVHILELSEQQKLNEAKQRESLEASKRKLARLQSQNQDLDMKAVSEDEFDMPYSPLSTDSSPQRSPEMAQVTTFGDIDERITPSIRPNSISMTQPDMVQQDTTHPILLGTPMDSDLRVHTLNQESRLQGSTFQSFIPEHRLPSRGFGPRGFAGGWRGARGSDVRGPRSSDIRGPRSRGPMPGTWRPNHRENQPPFEPMPSAFKPMGPLLGMKQMDCPLSPYLNDGRCSPPVLGDPQARQIPATDVRLLDFIDQDTMRTINIDGVAREIRFYDETAVVMLDWEDPREISFQPGQRRITFNDNNSYVLDFNEGYTDITIDGVSHTIRFGAPTRELFIDGRWYECFFGGPKVPLNLSGQIVMMQLDGPPPQVHIGSVKRTDLVAGKINMIIDALFWVPIFLDAKPQKFEIDGAIFTLRFVDALKTVLINEKPFKVDFFSLPKPIYVGRKKHFIRFSVLPRGIKPGQISIRNMEGLQGIPPIVDIPVSDGTMPILPKTDSEQLPDLTADVTGNEDKPTDPPILTEEDNRPMGDSGGVDMLASLMPSSMAPASEFNTGYSLATPLSQGSGVSFSSLSNPPTGIPGLDTTQPPPVNLSNINVNDLFAKLVNLGIVKVQSKAADEANDLGKQQTNEKDQEQSKPVRINNSKNELITVDLMRSDTLKRRQPNIVSRLYGGMQCSGCGCRFPPEQTVRYSQHLDWHFRANRRDRMAARRARSRDWHYDLSDWIQYQEIEDLDEREKSWFESQGILGEGGEDADMDLTNDATELPSSVTASDAPEDLRCELCRDRFRQFYNEDREEWQLARAVRHEGNNYHPLCLDEYKASQARENTKAETLSSELVDKSEPMDVEEGSTAEIEDSKLEEEMHEEKDEDDDKDSESVVEVISQDSQDDDDTPDVEVVEEILEDDDDVVFKAEPVEEIVVEDDVETDEETEKERVARDKQVEEFDFARIKIKQEPVDPDDEPVITAEEAVTPTQTDTTHPAVTTSMDGNLQLESATQAPSLPIGGIRINIAKPVLAPQKEISEDSNPPIQETELPSDEPAPPGEEMEIEFKIKPSLENVIFHKQRPIEKGTEMSALCSIM